MTTVYQKLSYMNLKESFNHDIEKDRQVQDQKTTRQVMT